MGYGTGLAITMCGFDFAGGLWGYKRDSEVDEFERRTQLRKAYRQPGEETIAQLGEGRGMFYSQDSHSHSYSPRPGTN